MTDGVYSVFVAVFWREFWLKNAHCPTLKKMPMDIEIAIPTAEAIDYGQTLADLADTALGNTARQQLAKGAINNGRNGEDFVDEGVGQNRLFSSSGSVHISEEELRNNTSDDAEGMMVDNEDIYGPDLESAARARSSPIVETVNNEEKDSDKDEEFSDPPIRALNNTVESAFDDGYDSDGLGPPKDQTEEEEEALGEEPLGEEPEEAANAGGDTNDNSDGEDEIAVLEPKKRSSQQEEAQVELSSIVNI